MYHMNYRICIDNTAECSYLDSVPTWVMVECVIASIREHEPDFVHSHANTVYSSQYRATLDVNMLPITATLLSMEYENIIVEPVGCNRASIPSENT
jgi:hypothetical protein